ncbi:MAG: hypothetical protein WC897_02575 [Candidatus Gracilibacteria bacterium]
MTITVTNRELLRGYKKLKNRLLCGEIKCIVIKQSDGSSLIMKPKEKPQTAFEAMVEQVKKHPINIKRPKADLFDFI